MLCFNPGLNFYNNFGFRYCPEKTIIIDIHVVILQQVVKYDIGLKLCSGFFLFHSCGKMLKARTLGRDLW